jgi:hypothetical protein
MTRHWTKNGIIQSKVNQPGHFTDTSFMVMT